MAYSLLQSSFLYFLFFYALLAFNMKTVCFTRGLHLAVSSVERSIFPWPGSKGTVITVVMAALEAGSPFRSSPWHLHGLQTPGHPSCWQQIHTYSAAAWSQPYAIQWGSLWPLPLLFRHLLGLERPGCSKHSTCCCLGPSKIKIIWRAVLKLFCNCFPYGCNFVPLVVCFFSVGLSWNHTSEGYEKRLAKPSALLLFLRENVGPALVRCEPGSLGTSSWKTSLWDYCSSVSASNAWVLQVNRILGNFAWLSLSSFFPGTGDHPARHWQLLQLRKGQVKLEKDK